MPAAARDLVIDARPLGPRGPMANEHVLGRSVLSQLVDLARECRPSGTIAIHARAEEHSNLRQLLGDAPQAMFRTGPPSEGAAILRTDRLYDAGRLRRALRSGRDPDRAVIWRLDRPGALDSADSELIRRRTYQPLGRYWALAPARAIARVLAPTRIHPNAVTVAAASMMLFAAWIVGSGLGWNLVAASSLAVALILDTADGHLARLQGTASEFGRWLDAVLDEMADMALHAGIAWGMFAATGRPVWLVAGMSYAMGKYLFVVATRDDATTPKATEPDAIPEGPGPLTSAVRLAGHADVRWHLWIVLAAFGHLEWALIAYAIYFPARTAAVAARKAVRGG